MLSSAFTVRALLVGHGLDLRHFNPPGVLDRDPFSLQLGDGGVAVLFRFGVVVLFGVDEIATTALREQLRAYVRQPVMESEVEILGLRVEADAAVNLEGDTLLVPDTELPRLQVIADVLAKSVLLDNYERYAATAFDRIEPLAEQMQARGHLPRQGHKLVHYIGDILQIQHRLVGRAQVGDKPDVLWDNPELERLWHRLEGEFEIADRQIALDRKLDLVGNTAETLLGLLQDRRTLRVEWYIVILIVIEIGLTLYELFFKHA